MTINISKIWKNDNTGEYIPDCGCSRCYEKRCFGLDIMEMFMEPIRFACELCGNKRCPHNADHRNVCTDSNEPGQPGSDY